MGHRGKKTIHAERFTEIVQQRFILFLRAHPVHHAKRASASYRDPDGGGVQEERLIRFPPMN